MEKVGLIEVLDRDGQVRQALAVSAWPVRIGRALNNDVVLDDPYVAAHHLTLDHAGPGLQLTVGETRNGVRRGREVWAAGVTVSRPAGEDWLVGRTRLRVRLPLQALAPELPVPEPSRWRPALVLGALGGLVGWLGWRQYLQSNPGEFLSGFATMLITVVVLMALWSLMWALGSKLFQHRFDYWTHVRIASTGLLASNLLSAVLAVLAFATSWVLLSRLRPVAEAAVIAVAIHAHLCAVLPARRRLLGWVAALMATAAVGTAAALQYQRTGRLTDELYLSTLPPPALRLAPAAPTDDFLESVRDLKPGLDRKAAELDDAAPHDGALAED
ncbi:FHA domain-containing protein [Caldimonas brevitalea]|uniref:FHA domain-containing protein n=1 Tax=Caldimonas brevitalea TaxID=413882 RepID=A0A0G3BT94_9BURK|nr:FHA domain-containing protein [Caldimonas brevitalea]AKJ31233.1 hypothetical protein AAW51_4542 [Caldimonas brevitalea]